MPSSWILPKKEKIWPTRDLLDKNFSGPTLSLINLYFREKYIVYLFGVTSFCGCLYILLGRAWLYKTWLSIMVSTSPTHFWCHEKMKTFVVKALVPNYYSISRYLEATSIHPQSTLLLQDELGIADGGWIHKNQCPPQGWEISCFRV